MFSLEDVTWLTFSHISGVYTFIISYRKKFCCTHTSIHECFDVIFDTYQLYMNYLTLGVKTGVFFMKYSLKAKI